LSIRTRISLAFAAALAVGLLTPASGVADFHLVENSNDSGPGSLRQAIIDSNASSERDLIDFAPSVQSPIFLTSGQLRITGDLTIYGPLNRGNVDIFASPVPSESNRVFLITDSANVTIARLSVRGGHVEVDNGQDASGGGILNQGRLRLVDSVVDGNEVRTGGSTPGGQAIGGGISNSGNLFLNGTSVTANDAVAGNFQADKGSTALGGGIRSRGELTMLESVIARNRARGGGAVQTGGDAYGGGIAVTQGGTLSGQTSAIFGNIALAGSGRDAGFSIGGGLDARGPTTLEASTISDNSAQPASGLQNAASGGGIEAGAMVDLRSSTLANNSAAIGANLDGSGGPASFKSSIVSNPQGGGANCAGVIVTSRRYNLESSNSCGFTDPTDQRGVDPKLGPLQDNGGPTPTRSIPLSSPALDHGITGDLGFDQRGEARPVRFPDVPLPPGGDGADVGAFEVQAGPAGELRKIVGKVDPDRAPAGERTCFHFKARKETGEPLRNVKVRLGGKAEDTGRHGGATICKRFDRAGDRHARLKKPTWETDRLKIKIFD
jgi:hypothetical protein